MRASKFIIGQFHIAASRNNSTFNIQNSTLRSAPVCALKAIERNCGLAIYNLGTGHGYSVLDVIKAFEKANGVKIRYSIKARRPGDIATCYCNPMKAKEELNWVAKYGIEDMCRDSWNWQKKNPNGY